MAPASGKPVCNGVQQQIASVCFTSSLLPSLGSGCTQSALRGSGPHALPPVSILGKVVVKLREYQCKRILIAPGWPIMLWFWELVVISGQIPLCLSNLPSLLTQPFSQIPHKNLSYLNLHAWILKPPLSRSKA